MAKRWFSAAAVAGLALALGSSPSMAAPEPLTDGELDLVVAAGVEADIEALQQALLEDVIIPHLRQVQARLAGYDLALHDQIGQLILELLGHPGLAAPGPQARSAGLVAASSTSGDSTVSSRSIGGEPGPSFRTVLPLGSHAAVSILGISEGGLPEISITTFESADSASAFGSIDFASDHPGAVQVVGASAVAISN